MDQITVVFLLLVGTVAAVTLSGRLKLPWPVLMTVYGLVLALLPGVPHLKLDPELLLPLLLPPLLYSAAWRTSWREFLASLRPIMLLAVALVVVTTIAVAAVAHAVVPGLPIAAALALGAVVAPPDPVAASAIAGQLRLPRRLMQLLESEGMYNDATAIVIYQVAVMAAVAGSVSPLKVSTIAVVTVVMALAIGFAVAQLAVLVLGRLTDPAAGTVFSLVVPFVAYIAADHLGGSGVLAVIVAALRMRSVLPEVDDVIGRLTTKSFWEVIELIVTGFAFGIVGLELRPVIDALGADLGETLWQAAAVSLTVIVVRALWLFPSTLLVKISLRGHDIPVMRPRETVAMWWAGMRGVATVALALAIPLAQDDGSPFPERDRLVAIAFAVVLVTLVLQGLTLPVIVRMLGIAVPEGTFPESERRLAIRAHKAALRRLGVLEDEGDVPEQVAESLRNKHHAILARLNPDGVREDKREMVEERSREMSAYRRLDREMTRAARQELSGARKETGVDPRAVDRVLKTLDVRGVRSWPMR